jgi:hypothetical protein
MNTPQNNPIDIECIDFQQSDLLEKLILNFGDMLHESLIAAQRPDEIETLIELTVEFSVLASTYGEQTDRIPEDLGVSLNEAAHLKLTMVKKHATSSEWAYYAQQTKDMLNELQLK